MVLKSVFIIFCIGLGFFLGKSQVPGPVEFSEAPNSNQIPEKKLATKPVQEIKTFADAESVLIKAKQEKRAYKPEKMKRFTKTRMENRFKRLRKIGATHSEFTNSEY
jgi:hypothetical protein